MKRPGVAVFPLTATLPFLHHPMRKAKNGVGKKGILFCRECSAHIPDKHRHSEGIDLRCLNLILRNLVTIHTGHANHNDAPTQTFLCEVPSKSFYIHFTCDVKRNIQIIYFRLLATATRWRWGLSYIPNINHQQDRGYEEYCRHYN